MPRGENGHDQGRHARGRRGGDRLRSREESSGRSGLGRSHRDIPTHSLREEEERSRRRHEEPLRQSCRISEAARKRGDDGRQGRRGDSRRSPHEREVDVRLRGEELWRSREGRRSVSHHRDHLRREPDFERREPDKGAFRGDIELEMRSRREDKHAVENIDRSRVHKRAHSRSVR